MGVPFDDTETPVWALTRPQDVLWRDWDDSGAIYDAGSGSTHLLNALGIEVLSLLMAAPRSEIDLLSELIDAMPDGMAAEGIAFQVSTQLHQLQLLGLAEPATIAA